MGGRSLKVASFLGEPCSQSSLCFDSLIFTSALLFVSSSFFCVAASKGFDVYNVEGGINSYAINVDPSIPRY
jgi:hypothetical protein